MKNLTNYQLEILAEAFMERIALKVEERSQTKAYPNAVETVKKAANYSKVKPILEKLEKITEKINKLNKEYNVLKDEYKKLHPGSYYVPTIEVFEEDIQKEAMTELAKDLPTKKAVESQIVLMNISKSDDILKDLGTKFGL